MKSKILFLILYILSFLFISNFCFAEDVDSSKVKNTNLSVSSNNVISEEQRKNNEEIRTRISQEKMIEAIELFYGAVAKFGEKEVAKQIIDIQNLTASLDSSVGNVQNTILNMDSSGGQFESTSQGIDKEIQKKIDALDKAVADAQAEVDKYTAELNGGNVGSSRGEIDSSRMDAERKLATARIKLSKAKKERKEYNNGAQVLDQTKKEDSMDSAKTTITDAEKERIIALDKGEKLYSAQEKLNRYVNDHSKSAVELAKKAKQEALTLLGIKVNNEYKASKGLMDNVAAGGKFDDSVEKMLLQRISREKAAQKMIDLFAVSGGASEYFKCSSDSDVECVSYHLMVAANAIYLAAQIREASDYNANANDIFNTDDNPDNKYDEQYKKILRAAKLKELTLKTAGIRQRNQQILNEMLQKVNDIAQIERIMKQQRLSAAKVQVEKAENNIKKIQRSIAIMTAIKLVETLITKKSLAVSVAGFACCSPYSSMCCAIGVKFKAISQAWHLKEIATAATIVYYTKKLMDARNELKRAKAELAKAKKHTHLKCWQENNMTTQVQKFFIKKISAIFDGLVGLVATNSHAESDAAAIGELDEAGIFKYYTNRKSEETAVMVGQYPAPEARAEYMQDIILQMMNDSLSGIDEIINELQYQNSEYSKIVGQMNVSAMVNDAGQVSGSTDDNDVPSAGDSAVKVKKFSFTKTDFGDTTNYQNDQLHISKKSKDSLVDDNAGTSTVASAVVGNHKVGTLVSDTLKNHDDAQKLLDKAKIKLTSDSKSKNSWKEHSKAIIEKFSNKYPEYKKFSADAIGDLNKVTKSRDLHDKEKSKENDKQNADDKSKLANSSKLNEKNQQGGKLEGMSMNFEDTQSEANDTFSRAICTPEQRKADPDNCALDPDQIAGERALSFLKDNLHHYRDTNEGTVDGIYEGKDGIFSIISKRYIKTALPIFFEKKKKE